jgi:hypothetical protein
MAIVVAIDAWLLYRFMSGPRPAAVANDPRVATESRP